MSSRTVRARAVEWSFGVVPETGNEYIAVRFEITQGESSGESRSWRGFFTDAAVDRTMESMRHCGWTSDNVADIADLDRNEVELVLEDEEYDGKTFERVRWVNRPPALHLKQQMNDAQVRSFAARMRAKAIASKQAYGGRSAQQPQQQRKPMANDASRAHREAAPPAADFAGAEANYSDDDAF